MSNPLVDEAVCQNSTEIHTFVGNATALCLGSLLRTGLSPAAWRHGHPRFRAQKIVRLEFVVGQRRTKRAYPRLSCGLGNYRVAPWIAARIATSRPPELWLSIVWKDRVSVNSSLKSIALFELGCSRRVRRRKGP